MAKRTCSFPDCGGTQKARGWCAAHYQQWRLTGEVKPKRWAEKGAPCAFCGGVVPDGYNRRKYCSGACQQAASRTKGNRPTTATCDFCGNSFSLLRERTGRLQRSDTKWCPDCGRTSPEVQRFRRYGITREQYEAASALGCSICGSRERKLHIDNDHSCCPTHGGRGPATCGECVRGLICGPCNRGLGLFGDDPGALGRAAAYLLEAHTRTRG